MRRESTTSMIVTAATLIGAAFFLVTGVWAFGWPRSFYDVVATYPPYNLHLFHDVGAFHLGIGAGLLSGLIWSDGLFVALVGGSVGASLHFVSHVLDRDLGGRASDPYLLGLLAAILVIGAWLRYRTGRPSGTPESG